MKEFSIEKCLPTIKRFALTGSVLFVFALLFEALTLIGAPASSVFDLSAWGKKRILIIWTVFIVVFALLQYFGCVSAFLKWCGSIAEDKKKIAKRVAFLVGGFIAAGSVGFGFALLFSFGFAKGIFFFFLLGSFFLILANWKSISLYPERVFVPVGIAMGIAIAVLSPVQPIVMYDDQSHFDRAIGLSYLTSAEYTEADLAMLAYSGVEGDPFGRFSFTEGEYAGMLSEFNALGSEYAYSPDEFKTVYEYDSLSYISLGYIPHAVGLWLGRLLHLPFVGVFFLGKICNLLFYFALVYFAVKRLKSQKVLVLAFSLLPAVLFTGGSYSYDIWVAGWLLFGFLRYLSWLQNPDEKLTLKEVALVLLAFIVGLGPKTIYFPIFFILLFIPRSKFPSKAFANRYRLVIVASALLILATFFLPFITQSSGGGDSRGGSDVSSGGQLAFMLENPLRYFTILGTFLADYLSIRFSATFSSHMGYLGASFLQSLPFVSLLLVAATDSGPANYSYAKCSYKVGSSLLLVGTASLIGTALYISYTSVGLDTIAGVHGRYLLPLVIPFLALFFSTRINNENSRVVYNSAVLSVCLVFIVVSVFELCLSIYTV